MNKFFRLFFIIFTLALVNTHSTAKAGIIICTPEELRTSIEDANNGGESTIFLQDGIYTLPSDYQ